MPKAATLSAPVLIDHLPVLLDEIAVAVGGEATALPAASRHAIDRLGSGFDLAEVIQEYGILRMVVVRVIGREHSPMSTRQAETIHRLIDAAMTRAVAFYTEATRRAFAAIDDVSATTSEDVRLPESLDRLLRAVVDAVPAVQAAAIVVTEGTEARIRATIGLEEGDDLFDTRDADRANGDEIRSAGFQNVWSLALRQDDHQVGITHVASRTAPEFSDEQTMLFSSMARRATDLVMQSRLRARAQAATLTAGALSTAASFDEAISNLLAAIGSNFGWDVAAFWTRTPGDDLLRRTQWWSASGVTAPHLEAATRNLVLARGEGQPGRVWQADAVWSGDVDTDPDLPRRSAATLDGFHTATVFPISDGDTALGVFEFFSRERRARADHTVEATAAVAGRLSDVLLHFAAQERIRRSEAEMTVLYREAQQATRMREQVMAIVSHDLRNPLNAITGAASLVLKSAGGPNEAAVRRAAEATLRSVDRMNRLIADLLDLASIQAGRLSVELQEQGIDRLLEEAVESHRSQAAAKGVEMRVSIDADVPACCVAVDRHRILQVLSNLIGNSVKFCEAGSTCSVRASHETDEIHVAVADTGPGIPHDELPHLFDPYWTGRQGRALGTGLGLFISKGIVEAHGGRLWVASETGLGSTFTFSLPLPPGV